MLELRARQEPERAGLRPARYLTAMAEGGDETEAPRSEARARRIGTRRWVALAVLAGAVALGGGLWWGLAGSAPSGPSARTTVVDCSSSLASADAGVASTLAPVTPTVVGVGSYASIGVFHIRGGRWAWCFDGMGTGGAPMPAGWLHGPVSVPLVLHDVGTASGQLLALVHHDTQTASVVVEASAGHARLVASSGQFEVLAVPLAGSLHWHAPWPRHPVIVGQVVGFSRAGLVTGSAPFTICPGSIDSFPGCC